MLIMDGNAMTVDYSLYLVADTAAARGRDLVRLVAAAVDGGVTIVQFRGKDVAEDAFAELACRLGVLLRARGIPFLINDRVDIAAACGADGVHLGQGDLPAGEARRILGPERLVGLSVHDVEQARAAAALGVDYVGLGPVYPTTTKATSVPILGPDGVKRVCAAVPGLPVVGIGGIQAGNARAVIDAGAVGIAVVSAVLSAPDARAAARGLRLALGPARRRG